MTFKPEKFIIFFTLVLLVILEPLKSSTLDEPFLLVCSVIFLFTILIHLFSQKNAKNWFRIDVLFLLGFSIVHFQWPIMLVFRGTSLNIPPSILSNVQYINYGTWLSAIGGVSWLLGYSFLPIKEKKYKMEHYFNYKRLIWFTWFLFLAFIITSGKDYLSGGIYKGSEKDIAGAGIAPYVQVLYLFCILLLTSFVIVEKKRYHSSNPLRWLFSLDKRYLVLAVSHILLYLSVGDRGGGLALLMAFCVLFGSFVRPIKLKELLVLILFGALLMKVIGIGRHSNFDENILSAGLNKIEISSGYDITLELANSCRTLYLALSHVPEEHDFFYGKLMLGNSLAAIPFAQQTYLKMTGDAAYELGSPGYLTYLVYGPYPPTGVGSTIIADIYLNFGFIGVILLMLILGMFFKKIANELQMKRSRFWIFIATLLASDAFYMGRASLLLTFRPLIWALILFFLLDRKKWKKKYFKQINFYKTSN